MKAEKAFKRLQKTLGKKKVELEKLNGYEVQTAKKLSDAEYIRAYAGPYMPIKYDLKNGKISSISFMRS